ncbi:gamma-glutamylcyclotransferase family protein [Lacimicrobium sp. SS2-24]|uniref:gamma-glutamylcyclotransferase family protein n=1 Tax=Lacimicrobium sp. SS2-24 TaxID=2005569 RepID=UPI00143A3E04|nr:gamma-glutamylcyclotransferase family protein [Lacimicrobium sp. SS2-24]
MKRSVRYLIISIAVLLTAGLAYLWFTFASSYGYTPPKGLPVIEDNVRHPVFVYGTLTHRWVRWLVMGRAGKAEPAELPGYRKQALNIEPSKGATTPGVVIHVNAEELRDLDRYERLGVRYERVKLTLKSGQSAWVYRLMEPALLDITEQIQE